MATLKLVLEVPDSVAGRIRALKVFGVDWHDDLIVAVERIVSQKQEEYLKLYDPDWQPKPTMVINEEAVGLIRSESASGVGYGTLAERWGVSKSCIQKIVTRRTWKSVP